MVVFGADFIRETSFMNRMTTAQPNDRRIDDERARAVLALRVLVLVTIAANISNSRHRLCFLQLSQALHKVLSQGWHEPAIQCKQHVVVGCSDLTVLRHTATSATRFLHHPCKPYLQVSQLWWHTWSLPLTHGWCPRLSTSLAAHKSVAGVLPSIEASSAQVGVHTEHAAISHAVDGGGLARLALSGWVHVYWAAFLFLLLLNHTPQRAVDTSHKEVR